MWLLNANPTLDLGFWHLLQTDNKEWFLDKSNQRQVKEGPKKPFQKLSVNEKIENFEELGETSNKMKKLSRAWVALRKVDTMSVGLL